VTDTNFFPHERQRVQVVTLLLLAAIIDSRSETLLSIIYGDIDLFVLRDKTTGEVALTLQLRLKKIKSRQKRKRPSVNFLSLRFRNANSNAEKPTSSL